MPAAYVPDSGDIVWINFDPQAGHEQVKHRPAVVLSPSSYNDRAGLLICCPTATKVKGYPFEVKLSGRPTSVALADQVKSFDWRARKAQKKGKATAAEMAEIRAKLHALIG
jgi:mRNA interferase MazF